MRERDIETNIPINLVLLISPPPAPAPEKSPEECEVAGLTPTVTPNI